MLATQICAAVVMTLGMSSAQNRAVCDYMPTIIEESNKNGIDPILFTSLIFHESAFRPRVVSRAGACGLTQVIPKYSDHTCEQLKRPKTSIREGTKALKYWLTRAKGDLVNALCGYNAGNVCINNPNSKRARIVKKNYSLSIINLANEIKDITKEKFYEEYLFYDKVIDDYDNLD